MRIAVASTDGENVDLHFGKAHSLYVYEYDEEKDELKFIDQRTVEATAILIFIPFFPFFFYSSFQLL